MKVTFKDSGVTVSEFPKILLALLKSTVYTTPLQALPDECLPFPQDAVAYTIPD